MAREFIANIPSWNYGSNRKLTVHSTDVYYCSGYINRLYKLSDVPDEANHLLLNQDDPELPTKIIQTLAPNAIWKTNSAGPISFRRKYMTARAKVLLAFVHGRLIPCLHDDTVRYREATLVYALHEGWTFDIGKEIFQSIKIASQDKTKKGIPFPSLITMICLNSGVEISEEDNIVEPDTAVGERDWVRWVKEEAAWRRSQPESVQAVNDGAGPSSSAPPMPPPSTMEEPPWVARLETQFASLEEQQHLMYQEFLRQGDAQQRQAQDIRRQGRELRYLSGRLDEFLDSTEHRPRSPDTPSPPE